MDQRPVPGSSHKPVVRLGCLCMEPDVAPVLAQAGVSLQDLLARHAAGDWGCVDEEEAEHQNEMAKQGGPVSSEFYVDPGEFVWVDTNDGVTCVRLAPNIHRC